MAKRRLEDKAYVAALEYFTENIGKKQLFIDVSEDTRLYCYTSYMLGKRYYYIEIQIRKGKVYEVKRGMATCEQNVLNRLFRIAYFQCDFLHNLSLAEKEKF